MKLYLSSYRIGSRGAELAGLLAGRKRMAVIRNALDGYDDLERRRTGLERELGDLAELGISAADLDLRDYFGARPSLERDLAEFDGLWVVGGNTFILRRAMSRSGLDQILHAHVDNSSFVYAGYSAGACVLAPTLRGIHLADEPERIPPGYSPEVLWDGLGLIPYCIVPHYRSIHPESPLMERVVAYLVANEIPYITLRDGEVHIGETGEPGNPP